MARQVVSVAVIGLGRMGGRHARAVMRSERCKLNWVIDTDPTCTAGFPGQHERFLSTLAPSRRPDLAIIATPSVNHAAAAGYLLSLGCVVLVEKPLTLSTASAAHLKGPLFVSHTERYKPVVQYIVERAPEVKGWYSHRYVTGATPNQKLSGGPLFDLAVHDFDLYRLFSGHSVVPMGVNASLTCVFAPNAQFEFGYSDHPGATANIYETRLSFLHGGHRLHVDFRENKWSTRDVGGQVSYNSSQDGVGAQLHDVVSFMDSGRRPKFLCDRDDAFEAVKSAELAMTLHERDSKAGSQVVEK